jgi:YhcH/YjgK/YiaL family protein
MVLDTLDNLMKYAPLHENFEKVFRYILQLDFNDLTPSTIVLDDSAYLKIDEVDLRSAEDAHLEVHDQYIDIQIAVSNSEYIGYRSRKKCEKMLREDWANDIAFFEEDFEFTFCLPKNSFAIFFPWDAHAPIIGVGKTKKIIAKVKIL